MFKLKKRAPLLKKLHLNTFPAIHLKKMDWLDFAVKFSGEMTVLLVSLAVAFSNLYFFAGSGSKQFSDNSLLAAFLNDRPDYNRKLAAKNSSIITTVSRNSAFFAQARADELDVLSRQPGTSDTSSDASLIPEVGQDMLSKPNPDSVQALIAKQIKIYQTQSGDTLKSIAAQNGVSVETIMWANNLAGQQIKPGWFLKIPPIDGVVHTMASNDTLPDIAKKYSGNMDTIISYNSLKDAEDFDTGDVIIIPGGKVHAPPAPPKPAAKPKPKVNNSGKVKPGGATEQVQQEYIADGSEHNFPKGYCTWYVAQKVRVPWGGNARNWLNNAKAYGAVISNEPVVGAIVVTKDSRRYGHVAYVESVDDNGFMVSEMNYEKFGKVDYRYIPKGSSLIKGFIYP